MHLLDAVIAQSSIPMTVAEMNALLREMEVTDQQKKAAKQILSKGLVKGRDGARSLLVPNIKNAGTLDFEQFLGAFDDLVARARTGRDRIAKFEGGYHGVHECAQVSSILATQMGPVEDPESVPDTPGIPQSAVDQVVTLSYRQPESLDKIRKHREELAAVIVEPVPSSFPVDMRDYLREGGVKDAVMLYTASASEPSARAAACRQPGRSSRSTLTAAVRPSRVSSARQTVAWPP